MCRPPAYCRAVFAQGRALRCCRQACWGTARIQGVSCLGECSSKLLILLLQALDLRARESGRAQAGCRWESLCTWKASDSQYACVWLSRSSLFALSAAHVSIMSRNWRVGMSATPAAGARMRVGARGDRARRWGLCKPGCGSQQGLQGGRPSECVRHQSMLGRLRPREVMAVTGCLQTLLDSFLSPCFVQDHFHCLHPFPLHWV